MDPESVENSHWHPHIYFFILLTSLIGKNTKRMETIGFLVTPSHGQLQSGMTDTMKNSRSYHFMKHWGDTLLAELATVLASKTENPMFDP